MTNNRNMDFGGGFMVLSLFMASHCLETPFEPPSPCSLVAFLLFFLFGVGKFCIVLFSFVIDGVSVALSCETVFFYVHWELELMLLLNI